MRLARRLKYRCTKGVQHQPQGYVKCVRRVYPCIPCEHTLVGTSSSESALAMFVVIVVAMIAPHNCCGIRKGGLCPSS